MDANLLNQLRSQVQGETLDDDATLLEYSHDSSIFEVRPRVVIFPKNSTDIKNIVEFVSKNKKQNPKLSITARAAGTDMSGGDLNDSIIIVFTKYINKFLGIEEKVASAQPGIFYRDFEKETLKHNLIFAPYPSSREICAIGGIVSNNAGGEKSFEYGKTEKYVKNLKVILADGNEYEFKSLNERELAQKLQLRSFEGEVYRKIHTLITKNYEKIINAKPNVTKNSTGYNLWNVYDKDKKTFDLTQLFVGAQGTLGIITEVGLQLIPVNKHSEMLVVYLNEKDEAKLGEIINAVIPLAPESFETYDDKTLELAVKYFNEFGTKLNSHNPLSTLFTFLPEILMKRKNKFPKITLQIEFTGNNLDDLKDKINELKKVLKPFDLKVKSAGNEKSSKKYWLIRRESFNLLRKKIKDKYSSPFIDDIIVNPKYLPEFLPKINAIIAKYPSIISTLAGHMGDGNFHIIPLVNLSDEAQRKLLPKISQEVFDLVFEYKGSMSGEHNDGLVRSRYLKQMYGEDVYKLFEKTKEIFDPLNIFNPGKKVNVDPEFADQHIRTSW